MKRPPFSERNTADLCEAAVRDVSGGAVLSVHVQPRASETAYAGLHGGAVKIRVAAAPTDGAANEALRRFLSEQCGVALRCIELMAGATSRQKRVMIRGTTADEVRRRLLEP